MSRHQVEPRAGGASDPIELDGSAHAPIELSDDDADDDDATDEDDDEVVEVAAPAPRAPAGAEPEAAAPNPTAEEMRLARLRHFGVGP